MGLVQQKQVSPLPKSEERYHEDMISSLDMKPASYSVSQALSLVTIAAILGFYFRSLVLVITLLSWTHRHICRYESDVKDRQAARRATLVKQAKAQRKNDIDAISTAVGNLVIKSLQEEESRLLVLRRATEKQQRQRDVQDITSKIIKHLIAFQETEMAQKEKRQAAKLEAIRKAAVAEEEKNRKEYERLEEQLREQEQREAAEAKRRWQAKKDNEEARQQQQTGFTLPYPLSEYAPLSEYFTCIGTTQKRRRCGMTTISRLDHTHAAQRLETMRSADPGNSFELDALRELADWMLCPRWHRNKLPQGERIAQQWYTALAPARKELASRIEARKRKSMESSSSHSLFSTPSTTASPNASLSGNSPSIFSISGNSHFSGDSYSSISSSSHSGFGTSPLTSSQSISSMQYNPLSKQGIDCARYAFGKDPAVKNLTPIFGAMNSYPHHTG